jgi:hypothetical protein
MNGSGILKQETTPIAWNCNPTDLLLFVCLYICDLFNYAISIRIYREVVGLDRGPLNLVGITEELLKWKSSGRGDPLRWPRDTLYPQKVGNNFADKRRSLGWFRSLAD